VVLYAGAFGESATPAACGDCPSPWLFIESAEAAPPLLRGGWREARHGS
jgi:hypothetical protein